MLGEILTTIVVLIALAGLVTELIDKLRRRAAKMRAAQKREDEAPGGQGPGRP